VVNKPERDAERAAIKAAYSARLTSSDRNSLLGQASAMIFLLCFAVGSAVFMGLPFLITAGVWSVFDEHWLVVLISASIFCILTLWYFLRVLLPFSLDVWFEQFGFFGRDTVYCRPGFYVETRADARRSSGFSVRYFYG
jgi:hypothetical protein